MFTIVVYIPLTHFACTSGVVHNRCVTGSCTVAIMYIIIYELSKSFNATNSIQCVLVLYAVEHMQSVHTCTHAFTHT